MNKGFEARQKESDESGDCNYGKYISREDARKSLDLYMIEWKKNYKPLPEVSWWDNQPIINPMIKHTHTWGKFFRYDFINWVCIVPIYLTAEIIQSIKYTISKKIPYLQ